MDLFLIWNVVLARSVRVLAVYCALPHNGLIKAIFVNENWTKTETTDGRDDTKMDGWTNEQVKGLLK